MSKRAGEDEPGQPKVDAATAETLASSGTGELPPAPGATARQRPPSSGAPTRLAPPTGERPWRTTLSAPLPHVEPQRYALGGELARGGMGRIVAARDVRLDRPVALKLLRDGSRHFAARFAREVRLTARLQHPAIVPVYEAGQLDGEPFYAMRLVAGRPLDQAIREADGLAEQLALLPCVIAVAEALAYAHDAGVVHRDVKPQNVLVGRYGETVLIDWGLAKELGTIEEPSLLPSATAPRSPRLTNAPLGAAFAGAPTTAPTGDDAAALTHAGDVMGTPAYMAPEQAVSADVDARADVYAVGAILYHLLSGEPPYAGQESWRVVEQVQLGPPSPIERLAPHAPSDLCAIVRKAMSREPGERYPSCKELVADLRAFQAGQLVEVHRYTLRELAARFFRRYRAAVAVALVAVLVLVAIGVIAVSRIARERSEALWQKELAQIGQNQAQASSREADAARAQVQVALARALEEQGQVALGDEHGARAAVLLSEAYRAGVPGPSLRLLLARAIRPIDAQRWRVGDAGSRIDEVQASFLGDRLAIHDEDESLRLFDLATGHRIAVLGLTGESIGAAGFVDDGKTLVTGGTEGTLTFWDGAGKPQLKVPAHPGSRIRSLAVSPRASLVITSDDDGRARLWGWPAALPLGDVKLPGAAIALAVDDSGVAMLYVDGAFESWDLRAGRQLARLRLGPTDHYAVLGGARLWLARGREVTLQSTGGQVSARWQAPAPIADLVADGEDRVVVVDTTGLAHHVVRDGAGVRVQTLSGGAAGFERLFLDGEQLIALHQDGILRVWSLATAALLASIDPPMRDPQVLVGAGRLVLAGGRRVAMIELGAAADVIGELASKPIALAGGGDVVLAHRGGMLVRWSLAGGRALAQRSMAAPLGALAVGPDAARSVIWDGQGARVLDAGLIERARLEGAGALVFARASSDGKRLWAAAERQVAVWDLDTGRRLASLPVPAGGLTALAPSPDERELLVGGGDGDLLVVDARSLTARAHLAVPGRVREAVWSPQGQRVAFLLGAQPQVWTVGGRELRSLGRDAADGLAVSPDGTLVAIWGGGNGDARVLRLADGARLADLEGHRGLVLSAAWDQRAGSGILYTGGADGRILAWEAAAGRSLLAWTLGAPILSVTASPDGVVVASTTAAAARLSVGEETRAPLEVSGRVNAGSGWQLLSGRLLRRE